nr:hypothetical protein MACL_00000967 [Theileria orientalis]
MELARAIYAYLVFHKVNKEYNNSQCSFLMCLDASFHGLDPYVSKTIFNNLFNVKTGLLVKNDLSVVLTTSKQTLEICSKMLDQNHIPNPPIYKIKNQTLQFHSNLHDFVNNNNVDTEDYMYLSARSSGPYNMSYLSNDMLRLCSSDATTRLGRMEMTRSKYSKSFKSYAKDELAELNDICVYTTPDLDPESMILTHLTVSAHRSEIIGIIGRTGAGKTTLLSVLQNIIENRTGQVMLDGKDLNDIPKVVLRQIIDPRRLFSDADINDALNKCGLLNFVNGLPGGMKLDTVLVQEDVSSIYEQCDNKANEEKINTESNKLGFISDMIISNSQIRTLNLARLVLYKDFYRMIVVDEPPQEDLAEEKRAKSDDQGIEIYNLLRKYFGHCTTFVTAHDVKVLKTCTSVWVIHEGSLVKTCKASDIAANESIASIIEECVKYS